MYFLCQLIVLDPRSAGLYFHFSRRLSPFPFASPSFFLPLHFSSPPPTPSSKQDLGKLDPDHLLPRGVHTLDDVKAYGIKHGICPYFAIRRMVSLEDELGTRGEVSKRRALLTSLSLPSLLSHHSSPGHLTIKYHHHHHHHFPPSSNSAPKKIPKTVHSRFSHHLLVSLPFGPQSGRTSFERNEQRFDRRV